MGSFRITGLLSESAKGTVYASVHQLTGERAAITLLAPKLVQHKAAFTRLVQQLYSVNALCHPAIVNLRAVGLLDSGLSFVSVELLDGLNLRQLLRRDTRLAPGLVLPLFEQLCHALGAVHAAGLAHGRIAPRAIFVLRGPPHPTVRLRGFGDACLEGAAQSIYAAPELRSGGDPSASADIYALGALLFELVTGRRPPSDALMDASLVDLVDEALMRVVLKAMAARATERYVAAGDLLDALRAAIPSAAPWETVNLAPPPPGAVEATRVQSPEVEPAPAARPQRPSQELAALAPESIEGEISAVEIETKHNAVLVRRPDDLNDPAPTDDAETEVSSIPTPEFLAPELAPGGALGELNPAELYARERKATGADVPPSGEHEPGAPLTGEADELFDEAPKTGEADELFDEAPKTGEADELFDEAPKTGEADELFDEAPKTGEADELFDEAPKTGEADELFDEAPKTDVERRSEGWIDPASPYLKTLQGVGDGAQPEAGYEEADATEGERPPEPTRPYATPGRPAPTGEDPAEAVVVVSPDALDKPPAAIPADASSCVNDDDDGKSQISTSVFEAFELVNPEALDGGGGFLEPDVTSPYGPSESALATQEAVQPQPQIVPQPEAATRVADLDPGVIEQLARLRPELLTELGPDGVAALTPEKLDDFLSAPMNPPTTLPPEPIASSDAATAPTQEAKEPPTPSPLSGSSEPVLAPQPALGRVKLAKASAAGVKTPRGTVGLPEELAKTSRLSPPSLDPDEPDDDAYASIEVVGDEDRDDA